MSFSNLKVKVRVDEGMDKDSVRFADFDLERHGAGMMLHCLVYCENEQVAESFRKKASEVPGVEVVQ